MFLKGNITDILKGEPKEPFTVQINLNQPNGNIKDVFEGIKNIFMKGLMIQSGMNGNKLDIKNITQRQFEQMKKHMLSMGIDVKLKVHTNETKDMLYRNLLNDIQSLNITIKVLIDWKTDLIEKLNIVVPLKEKNKYIEILQSHHEANHFLQLAKQSSLKDFAIFIKYPGNVTNVLYFDFAKQIR